MTNTSGKNTDQFEAGRLTLVSLAIWLIALCDALGGLFGFWSVAGAERDYVLAGEALLLLALLANAVAIRRWVLSRSTSRLCRQVAALSVASLVLCLLGDLVNFNLPESYFRYGPVVKHDYLADSVWFFAPGYGLLLYAVVRVSLWNGARPGTVFTTLAVGGLLGGLAVHRLHLPGTGDYVSAMTGGYAVLISALGASGLALMASFGRYWRQPAVVAVCAGIVLAAVADSVIGQFWVYGNQGVGYFPEVRYLNWMVYIGSQCLVIHLARVAVLFGRRAVLS